VSRLPLLRGARSVVCAFVLVVAAACFGVIRPAIERVALDESRLADATQALDADRLALERLRAFPSLRRRYREQIGSVDVRSSDAVLVADFLASAVRDAARRDVAIVSLTADPHTVPAAGTAPFREISLVLTQEGRYADVLATLDAFSRSREIVRVDGIDLTRRAETTSSHQSAVRAVIALRLLRLDRDPANRGDEPAKQHRDA
jgi:hypothetical protein